jgi:hypothetical protein
VCIVPYFVFIETQQSTITTVRCLNGELVLLEMCSRYCFDRLFVGGNDCLFVEEEHPPAKIVFFHTKKCGGWTIANYFKYFHPQLTNECVPNKNDWRCSMQFRKDTGPEQQCSAFREFITSRYLLLASFGPYNHFTVLIFHMWRSPSSFAKYFQSLLHLSQSFDTPSSGSCPVTE